jgi:hypothetical protein
VIYVNPPTWGLANAPMTEVSPHRFRLDFSWDAVPPLVDLGRIVLPAARAGNPFPGQYVTKS